MQDLKREEKLKSFLYNYFDGIEPGEVINIRKIKYNVTNENSNLNNIIELLTLDKIKYTNTYFNLSTFKDNSNNYKEENVAYRYSIAFDWDLKDFLGCSKDDLYKLQKEDRDLFDKNKKLLLDEIYSRTNKIGGLCLHYVIDSGYGYHAYILINKSNDLNKIRAVQKELIRLLDSDTKCSDIVRVLRVPFTNNVKNNGNVKCKIVKDYVTNNLKFERYSIDRLYNRFCEKLSFKDYTVISNTIKKDIPLCVENALKNGSVEGERDRDLYNIVIHLKKKGKSLEEIKIITENWNSKNEVCFDDLDYQTKYIFENCNGFLCNSCDSSIKLECKSYTLSNFNLQQYGESIIDIHTKVGRQCRESNRKGVVCMNGNELFIYNVLLNNKDIYLSREGILKLITDRKTKKTAISERTLIDTLKGLMDKDYVIVNKGIKKLGIADTYKLNTKKIKEDNTIKITYFINLAVIWGRISTEELKCYIRMRYLHHEAVKNGKAKGNIFSITMEELAKDLGITVGRVSQMTKNLYDNNILDRRAIPLEEDVNKFRYEYKLNM